MKRQRTILIGIVGDSGSGKSTLAEGLLEIIGRDRATHLSLDDYHRYDRAERERLGITPLDPACNYVDEMERHLEQLRYGLPILKPVYDHATGSLGRAEYVEPREFVLVDGLLAFWRPMLRDFLDLKIFLDPPEALRREWKVRRDTTTRGYTAEQVEMELVRREADSQRFIRPQREHADIVVRFYPAAPTERMAPSDSLNAHLVVRPTTSHTHLTTLLEETQVYRHGIRLDLGRDATQPDVHIEIDDDGVSTEQARRLEQVICRQLPELTPAGLGRLGSYRDCGVVRHSEQLALTQLLLAYHLLRPYTEEPEPRLAPPGGAMRRARLVGARAGSPRHSAR